MNCRKCCGCHRSGISFMPYRPDRRPKRRWIRPARSPAQGGRYVGPALRRLAGAADEDRVAPGVEESAGGEFAHLALIDRRIGEDERVQVLEDGELGPAHTVADRAGLAVRALGPDQAGDEGVELIAPVEPLSISSAIDSPGLL